MTNAWLLLAALITTLCARSASAQVALPVFSSLQHQFSTGSATALDAKRLRITDFRYDGLGPGAYFYAGSGASPASGGDKLNVVTAAGSCVEGEVAAGTGQTLIVEMPPGKTVSSYDWFSLWCVPASANFGDLRASSFNTAAVSALPMPAASDIGCASSAAPLPLGNLRTFAHLVSGEVHALDSRRLLIKKFVYDGAVGGASALLTFICVIWRTQNLTMQLHNFTHTTGSRRLLLGRQRRRTVVDWCKAAIRQGGRHV
jgi:hypothetical protein